MSLMYGKRNVFTRIIQHLYGNKIQRERKHFICTPLYRLILKLKSVSLIYYCVNRSERKLNRIIYFTSLAKSIFICVEIFYKDSKYVYFFSFLQVNKCNKSAISISLKSFKTNKSTILCCSQCSIALLEKAF